MLRSAALALAILLAPSARAQWLDDCGLQPPGSVPSSPVPAKAWEPSVARTSDPVVSRVLDQPTVEGIGGFPTANTTATGALTGKVVYLSPGHGFTWTNLGSTFDWHTQRPATNGIVEDLVSAETLGQYLIPLLQSAGAHVVAVRETDLNPNLIIVDNDGPGYAESGSAGFQASSLKAWGAPGFPMGGDVLPFTLGTNRLMNASSTVTGTATYTATIPEDGYYDVSVTYTAFSARVADAHYVVHHAGGATHFRVNQQRHGGTFETLGRFFFRAGPTSVEVLNDSATPTGNVSLDAVKWGGGMGLITRTGTSTDTSGRPRFEEAARYHAQFAGAPLAVFAPTDNTPAGDRTNDIGTRSRFAAWVHEPGEDAVYVAWHTNAFDGTAVGTTTYVYGPNPPDGTYDFTGVDGGDALAAAVHAELINDIKAPSGWNQPTWRDRGVDSAYFGELNPANNPETPSILIEVAFHDAPPDATQLKEPNFRYLAARAITQGLIKYFAKKDGVAPVLPPEPPVRLSLVVQGGTNALLKWQAGPTDTEGVRGQLATSYRVYSSTDGLGWDNGQAVTGTSLTVTLPAAAPRYYRVTGLNAGGESFPSSVVGARVAPAGRPTVLVVNGYERLEAAIAPYEAFPAHFGLGTVERAFILRMNDGASLRLHGEALDVAQVGFDSADTDAFVAGDVTLAHYALIDWEAGRGRAGGAAPTTPMQTLLLGYQTSHPLLISGELSQAPAFVGAFAHGTLDAGGGTRFLSGTDAFAGLDGVLLSSGSGLQYGVGLPGTVAPASGAATTLATYDTAAGAAIGTPQSAIYLAFPFEGLVDRTQRLELMRRSLVYLLALDAGAPLDAGPVDAGYEAPDAGRDAGANPADAGPSHPSDGGVVAGVTDGGTQPSRPGSCGGGCTGGPSELTLLGAIFVLARPRIRRHEGPRKNAGRRHQ